MPSIRSRVDFAPAARALSSLITSRGFGLIVGIVKNTNVIFRFRLLTRGAGLASHRCPVWVRQAGRYRVETLMGAIVRSSLPSRSLRFFPRRGGSPTEYRPAGLPANRPAVAANFLHSWNRRGRCQYPALSRG